MIALLRYQMAILLRSHRWLFPFILYIALLAVGFGGSEPLRDGLDWNAAILVPVVALATRSLLTAEPGPARACVAAAAGPIRAHLATLLTAVVAGAVLALAGACYEVLADQAVIASAGPGLAAKIDALTAHPVTLLAGLVTALVCLMVGSAAGALCNPPLLRHPALALLGTAAAVLVSLGSGVSPASAVMRGNGATVQASAWPDGLPLLVAAALLALCWTVSALAAAHRSGET